MVLKKIISTAALSTNPTSISVTATATAAEAEAAALQLLVFCECIMSGKMAPDTFL